MKSLKRSLDDLLSRIGLTRRTARTASREVTRRLLVEQLEDRQMLTATQLFWMGGASSNWNATDANWSLASGGSSNQTWNSSDQAVFGGSAGTAINVASGVTADSLQFTTAGYTLSGGSLALSGTDVINVGTGLTDTISSPLTVGSNFTQTGGGSLIAGDVASSGSVQVNAANNLTVASIVAGSLVIGGTSANHATVTIAATQNGPGPTLLYWDGAAAGNWTWNSTNTNWSPNPGGGSDEAWNSSAVAVFNGAGGTVSVAGGMSASSVDFWTAGYTLSGGTLAVPSGINVNAGLQDTISSQLTGSIGLVTSGGGTLLLSGSNTYTGPTLIASGTLELGSASALGNSPYVSSEHRGTLDLNGQTIGSATSLDFFLGTLINSSSTNATFAGAVNDSAAGLSIPVDLNVGGSGNITLSGVIAGAASGNLASANLNKSGSGTLVLTAHDTYTGATNITGGTGSLGNTAITVADGATFAPNPGAGSLSAGSTVSGGATLSLASGSTFDMTDGSTGTFQLEQPTGFTGASLSISDATLTFELSSSNADELTTSRAASVSGIDTINITALGSSLSLGGSYNLIAAASGLGGNSFVFSNGAPFEAITVGTQTYTLVLTATDRVLTLGVANPNLAALTARSFSVSPDQSYLFGDNLLEHVTDNSGNFTAAAAIAQIGGQPYVQDGQTFDTAHGQVMAFDNGDFQYSPTDGFVGSDSFSYTVAIDGGTSTSGTVTLTVPAGQLSVATIPDQQWYGGYDTLDLNNYFHDTRYGIDQLTLSVSSSNANFTHYYNASYGELTLASGGAAGNSDVTVTATDPDGASALTTFHCSVGSAFPPIVGYAAYADGFAGLAGSYGFFCSDSQTAPPFVDFYVIASLSSDAATAGYQIAFSLLNNPSNASIDPITGEVHWSGSKGMGPTVVKLTVRATEIPPTSFAGQPASPAPYTDQSFYLSVGSGNPNAFGQEGFDTAWDPVAEDSEYSTSYETAIAYQTHYDIDPSEPFVDTLVNTLDTGPAHGTLSFNQYGVFTYTPDAGFSGDDSFTYHVTGYTGYSSNVATVTIHVAGQLSLVPDIADLSDIKAHGLGTPPSIFSEVPPSGTGSGGGSDSPSGSPGQGADSTTLTTADQVEIWYQRNARWVEKDMVNARDALFDAYFDYLKSDSTFGQRAGGYLANYAMAKLPIPGGTEIRTVMRITANEAKIAVSRDDTAEFVKAERRVQERAEADALNQLGQAKKELLAALAANPSGIVIVYRLTRAEVGELECRVL